MTDNSTPSPTPSPAETGASYTYADAGVSIAAGNALVRAIGPLAKATRRPGPMPTWAALAVSST